MEPRRSTPGTPTRSAPSVRNGVDTATLFTTLATVERVPDAAQFRFRARNRWVSGVHSHSTVVDYFGVGREQEHERAFALDADHPLPLVGTDRGPTPAEYVLVSLASCLTAGIANIAATRGVDLAAVTSVIEGDLDLTGVLGLREGVRNGFQGIEIRIEVSGDAPADTLREIVEQSRSRSVVHDVVANPVPVSIDVVAGRGPDTQPRGA
ncbi:MAG: OsmC family protein [Acidimicrobiia bacterium]